MAPLHRIIVASDSFKGSLPSWEVAEAVEKAVREVCPGCEVTCLSVADGGEGTAEALCKAFSGEMLAIRVRGPLSGPVEARYCIAGEAGKRTAVLEMSQASGLNLKLWVKVKENWRDSDSLIRNYGYRDPEE